MLLSGSARMWLSNVSSHSLYQPWSIRAVGTDVQVAHAMGTSRKWPDVLYFVSVTIWLGLSPSCCLRRVKLCFPKILQYESLSDLNKKKKQLIAWTNLLSVGCVFIAWLLITETYWLFFNLHPLTAAFYHVPVPVQSCPQYDY